MGGVFLRACMAIVKVCGIEFKTRIPGGWRGGNWMCPHARVIGSDEWHPAVLGQADHSGMVWWNFNGQRWPEYLLEWR